MQNLDCPIDVKQLTQLQQDTVAKWHHEEVANPYVELEHTVCEQHSFNFKLWHEEDIARSPDVTDTEIARVKRSIDKLNQNRNDWIENVDDAITELLNSKAVSPSNDAPLNTETPGSALDRLSIMALRIYHLREQLERTDVGEDHIASVENKIAVCLIQVDDLSNSLQELLNDIFAGKKRHRTYRQFKMYNDPTLNPYLYEARKRATA